MIVREVLGTPALVDTLDLFNDAADTLTWLQALARENVHRAGPLADRLEARIAEARAFDAERTLETAEGECPRCKGKPGELGECPGRHSPDLCVCCHDCRGDCRMEL